jgi:hypothetical protein
VVDDQSVPERLEDAVREPQRQHVLDRLLAEVVVDPVDLALVEILVEDVVQLDRRGEVVPERLLDDHSRPAAFRRPCADPLDDRLDDVRRDGEIADTVAWDAAFLVERGQHLLSAAEEGFCVHEIGRHVANSAGQSLPDVIAELVAAELLDGGFHPLSERVVGLLRAGYADDREMLGQQLAERERVERRKELALRQVSGGAEDHHRARLGPARQRQPHG